LKTTSYKHQIDEGKTKEYFNDAVDSPKDKTKSKDKIKNKIKNKAVVDDEVVKAPEFVSTN
jgi:hypothetical protein